MAEGPEDKTGKPTQQDQAPPQIKTGISLSYDEIKEFFGELCLLIVGARSRLRDAEQSARQAQQGVFALMNRVRELEGPKKPPEAT